ncbi:MAG: hypothetical protein SGJ15_07625 [Bacteroidota bacterium]|nr:hypothetical protein [Bacteroidota bacterium]
MKKPQLIVLTFLASAFIAQGQSPPKIEKGWKTFSQDNYTIQYPENWLLDSAPKMGMSLVVFSKLTSPNDQFKENINLLVQDLKGKNIDLTKYVEISEEQISTLAANGKLIETKRRKENGSEFQKMIYTSDDQMFKLKYEQYYWIKNEKAYVLTCEASQFETYKAPGEKIMNSFKFK